ncbi:NIP1 [Auxenochlorella protothecoides x Auxenochlorella symbiontica]
MLQTVVKHSSTFAPRVTSVIGQRAYAHDGMKGYGEKERGEETVYFRKEEEKLLRTLLQKVAAQASKHDVEGSKAAADEASAKLETIVGGKLSAAEKAALLEWKNSH